MQVLRSIIALLLAISEPVFAASLARYRKSRLWGRDPKGKHRVTNSGLDCNPVSGPRIGGEVGVTSGM